MSDQGELNSLSQIVFKLILIYILSIVITHNGAAKTDHNDNEILVSSLLKKQRDLKTSINSNTQLSAVDTSPQWSQWPQTRS